MNEINTLKSRVQWHVARALLRSLDLPVGHGWDKTLLKLQEIDDRSKSKLHEASQNHVLCGDKSVRVYKLRHLDYDRINKASLSSIDKTSLLTKSYPFCLSDEELAEVELDIPEIVHVQDNGELLYVVYASHKSVRVREAMDRALLAKALEESNATLAGRILASQEVFSVRVEQRHAYDIVCIHKDREIAEVRVDLFENLSPLKLSEIEQAHRAILHRFNDVEEFYLTNQINLYPAIKGLLHINEGGEEQQARVTRFSYLGSTGISREERKLHGDVRSDPTHLAALNAHRGDSAPITPYDIEVQLPGGVLASQPYIALRLHGTETLARSENPVLGEMAITKCLYEADFQRVTAEVYRQVV